MLLARLPHLRRVGRPPPRGRIAPVPLPALAAAGDRDPRAGVGEVGDRVAGLAQPHLRPTGTSISRSSPRRPCFPEPWPCTPRWARKCEAVRNRERSRRSALGDEHHVTAVAAVAAVRAALRDVLLPAEADAAVTAATALHLDGRAVGEHRGSCGYADCSASTLM